MESPAPDRILARLLAYNARASAVRKPPFTGKTWIAVVRCMDRKLDMNRIFGDMKFGDEGASWPLTTTAVDETPRNIEQLQRAPIIAPTPLAGHLAMIRATVVSGTDQLTEVSIYRPATGGWEPLTG
jgi:hypothetical protein